MDEEKDRSQIIRIKAQIQDIKISQDGLANKIDEANNCLRELAKSDRVDYYIRLIESMEELNVKYDELVEYGEELKKKLEAKKQELKEL